MLLLVDYFGVGAVSCSCREFSINPLFYLVDLLLEVLHWMTTTQELIQTERVLRAVEIILVLRLIKLLGLLLWLLST